MRGIKRMLLGITVILAGIAASTMNFLAWVGAAAGILLVLVGLDTKD